MPHSRTLRLRVVPAPRERRSVARALRSLWAVALFALAAALSLDPVAGAAPRALPSTSAARSALAFPSSPRGALRSWGPPWTALSGTSSTGSSGTPGTAPSPPPSRSSPQPTVHPDALATKIRRWRRADAGWNGPGHASTERVLAALRERALEAPDEASTWQLLLEGAVLASPRTFVSDSQTLRSVGRTARFELVELLRRPESSALERWLLSEVIVALPPEDARARFPHIEDRRTALDLLEAQALSGLRVPLLTVARRADDPLRPDALRTLARWAHRFGADEAIDLFLVDLLGERFDKATRPHPYSLLLERVRSSTRPLGQKARTRLRSRVEQLLLANDWRDAARAIQLTEGYPLEERISLLIDALYVWHRREATGRPVPGLVRVRGDLVRVLRRISGQFHGTDPGPWLEWWIRVGKGEAPMPGSAEHRALLRRRAEEPRSQAASFFGIRPESDRFTFVLDVSGSMHMNFGTTERTRYVEAIDQLVRFLHAAPEGTRFSVVLFSSTFEDVYPEPVEVTPDSLDRLRRDLLAKRPGGGTNLRPAFEHALRLGPGGLPREDASEADTFIVLCDGATSGGRAWVDPLFERVLPEVPILVHGVLIGDQGDGTLEELARLSGGQFIRTGG